ncbi:hypothetical protein HK099_000083 [Clydaea vesicula]|uniref:Basal body-orientation factor 1 n=1 Tax=Clydaea vesicula TaxID=447962 RepID=A0AAD5U4N5_9FUNG|nr:hypothetical protein HK099_000083 [Clydaea vesicula]KAJ3386987.1 hypothetical protein HDU92_002186 [Lobulomyces angularis]
MKEISKTDTEHKKTKKKRKGKGKKKHKDDKVKNSRGEIVSLKEYALEQTLEATNRSLGQYRERMDGFLKTNETLQELCNQQEQDALEVIAALQQDAEKKENELKEKEENIELIIHENKYEVEGLKNSYERKLLDVNSILNEKEAAFKVMQSEFSVIKDFRKKRHELLKDLESQKLELQDTEKRHKEIVAKMERKFFEEKIRLQKDANRKISELATKAHKEAVANLKETTKEVYKENIRMAEALSVHVQEGEELKAKNLRLTEQNRFLLEEKELHNVIVKEKILQYKQQCQEIKFLQEKVTSMEHSLSHVVREFEHEREIIGNMAKKELEEVRKVSIKLGENLVKKTAEMKHIKRLAQHILDQRTELEKFFMESLETVKKSSYLDREEERKHAMAEYNKKIRMAMIGKASEFPTIQSFRQKPPDKMDFLNQPTAPSIFADSDGKTLDVSELTWSDKERVLRLLFAKMNGISYQPINDNNVENASIISSEDLNGRMGSIGESEHDLNQVSDFSQKEQMKIISYNSANFLNTREVGEPEKNDSINNIQLVNV